MAWARRCLPNTDLRRTRPPQLRRPASRVMLSDRWSISAPPTNNSPAPGPASNSRRATARPTAAHKKRSRTNKKSSLHRSRCSPPASPQRHASASRSTSSTSCPPAPPASSRNNSSTSPRTTPPTSCIAFTVRWSSMARATTTPQSTGYRSSTTRPPRSCNSARPDVEPPSLVQYAQEAVSWLASAIINLDHDAPGTPEALTDGLGRVLTLCVFADAARAVIDSRHP